MSSKQSHLLVEIDFRYTFQTVILPDGNEHTIRRLETAKTWILFPTISGDRPVFGEWETVPEVVIDPPVDPPETSETPETDEAPDEAPDGEEVKIDPE